jgi:hypothetical protein
MEAGREMDAMVAKHVMGLRGAAEGGWSDPRHLSDGRVLPGLTPRPYSTSIAVAWAVVEKMGERGFHCRIVTPFYPGRPYHVGFTPHGTTGWNGRHDHEGSADTMPHAICLAALRACGVTLAHD